MVVEIQNQDCKVSGFMEYISGNFMPNSGEFCRFACYIDTVIDSRILPQNTKFNPFLLAASLS